MSFFVTFEHALGKAIDKIKAVAVKDLPKAISAVEFAQKSVPVAEEVATALDPQAAAAITAVGNGSSAVFARVLAVLHDEQAFQDALKNGTVTIKMATDEINDAKAVIPTVLGTVQAMGLAHTIPAPAAAPAN